MPLVMLIVLTAAPVTVTLVVENKESPGMLEVRAADGGVLLQTEMAVELTAELPVSEGYDVRLTRRDSTASGHFASAERAFRIEVTVRKYHLEVETYEPAPELVLEPERIGDRAAFYRLINRGSGTWWARPWASDAQDPGKVTACWHRGTFIDAGTSVGLGFWDEPCVLEGEKTRQVAVVVRPMSAPNDRLRKRSFVVRQTLRAADVKGRWVPDAGRLGCICRGTELGLERELVLETDFGSTTFQRRDGGVHTVQRTSTAPRVGDHAPYVLPPGAGDHPDFSGWQ